ncbi:hypothetical protein CYANOKiyG1_49000 [Okeania sp. KiyG1]|nr:hypothetical protein CYANOKiyG1_49000 [Okeania sp. KiyG1]
MNKENQTIPTKGSINQDSVGKKIHHKSHNLTYRLIAIGNEKNKSTQIDLLITNGVQ